VGTAHELTPIRASIFSIFISGLLNSIANIPKKVDRQSLLSYDRVI
jgi:hypothetical protein